MTCAKIYELNPSLMESSGIIQKLKKVLRDSDNPLVICNTLLSLSEIEKTKGEKLIETDAVFVKKIVDSLPECSEWGQVSILEILCIMDIKDLKSAEYIVDRVLSRLSHINPAVIVAAIKVILKYSLVLNNQ